MFNQCTFIGNVGKDPESRAMQNGKEVCNLSLGVTERWKDASGERKEKTEWVRIVIFNEGLLGVVRNYVKKGSKLMIQGALQTRKWQNNEGVDQYSTEIVLQGFNSKLVMLDGKESQPTQHEQAKQDGYAPQAIDDEIPF